jgi:hypothetical protein
MLAVQYIYMYIYVVPVLPKEVLEWRPSGRRKRGTPKLTLPDGIRGMMGEKGLKEEDWAGTNMMIR